MNHQNSDNLHGTDISNLKMDELDLETNLEYDDDLQSLSQSSMANINVDLDSPNKPHVGHVYSEINTQNATNNNNLNSSTGGDGIATLSNSNSPQKEQQTTTSTRNHPPLPGSVNITDVYELAAAIGNTMEPLLSEFGQEKMEKLTKEIVRCLESFEKTVNILTKETENSLEYQYKLEKSKHELIQNKQRHEKEVGNLDNTIDQLQMTIDSLQVSHDMLVDNFDWDEILHDANVQLPNNPNDSTCSNSSNNQASTTELKLAK
jgi:Sec-independent protein translocase protein TatA